MEKAIFINKDGIITANAPQDFNTTRLLPGSGESLAVLKKTGFKVFLLADQPPRRMDYYEIIRQLLPYEASIDGFYYCPHSNHECNCHKPKAGLLFEAAEERNLDLKNSWIVGDKLDDIEAGNRAGCRTVLLTNGAETQWHVTPVRQPEFLSPCFEYAVGAIVLKTMYQMIREQQIN
ncbi:MAG: HAD-IIIA family hydrolase [Candidatus Doudnabacteria bacterium]|nr:HAD-IIIA family hydrolase [Candidatus Doudnabacteria bacterium]